MTSPTTPADCCTGTLHDGTPVGRVETLHNFPCYITDPPLNAAPKAIIILIPDAFGWELPNSRVLADNYAKRLQCQVLLPELMDGHHLDWALLDSLNTVTDKEKGLMHKMYAVPPLLSPFLCRNLRTQSSQKGQKFLSLHPSPFKN